MIQQYEFFEHPADLGVIGHGETLESAVAGVLQAVFDQYTDTEQLAGEEEVIVEVEDDELDLDDLLVDLLSKVLLLFELEKFLGKRAQVNTIGNGERITGIRASIHGEYIDMKRHSINVHIKAATYHGLDIWQDSSGWHVKVLFDV